MKIDVARLVREATAAAKHAPDHLQQVAFNKAFEALVAAEQEGTGSVTRHLRAGKKVLKHEGGESDTGRNDLDRLDRTQYSSINHNDSALNNSLRLLRACKDDLNIDGLPASQIARVLVNKFRCKVSRQAVSLALNRAGRYVNRHNEGGLVIFRVMATGEEYLDQLKDSTDKSKPSVARNRKGKKTGAEARKTEHPPARTKASSQKPISRTKAGPAIGMSQLYNSGFFSSGRTIAAITDRLKHAIGRTFKQNELSPVLLRWLRNGKLTRNLNSDKQYEYKQP